MTEDEQAEQEGWYTLFESGKLSARDTRSSIARTSHRHGFRAGLAHARSQQAERPVGVSDREVAEWIRIRLSELPQNLRDYALRSEVIANRARAEAAEAVVEAARHIRPERCESADGTVEFPIIAGGGKLSEAVKAYDRARAAGGGKETAAQLADRLGFATPTPEQQEVNMHEGADQQAETAEAFAERYNDYCLKHGDCWSDQLFIWIEQRDASIRSAARTEALREAAAIVQDHICDWPLREPQPIPPLELRSQLAARIISLLEKGGER